jgi:arabinogalactan endo-1,4-beta-galactosidase
VDGTELTQEESLRAKTGFRILIDFHFSDTWADPQPDKTCSWTAYDFRHADYYRVCLYASVLDTLKSAALFPVGYRLE